MPRQIILNTENLWYRRSVVHGNLRIRRWKVYQRTYYASQRNRITWEALRNMGSKSSAIFLGMAPFMEMDFCQVCKYSICVKLCLVTLRFVSLEFSIASTVQTSRISSYAICFLIITRAVMQTSIFRENKMISY